MFFSRPERKRKHPILTLTVAALSSVGAITLVSSVKHAVRTGAKNVGDMCRKVCGKNAAGNED